MDRGSSPNRQIAKSFAWVTVERFAALGIQFVTTMILSRILSQSDFGIIGILMIFLAVACMLTDSGMGGSLIKQARVDYADYSTLFIYNMGVSIALYLLLFGLAGPIARFYDIPEIRSILRVVGLLIVTNALGQVQNIRLTRKLDFKTQAIITITSFVVASVVAIYLACKGFGVWVLVYQLLIQSALNTMGLIAVNRFIPSLRFSVRSFREQWNFGVHLLGANMLNTINANIYSSVIGKAYTTHLTGLYVQSYRVQNLPTSILTAVVDKAAFPVLSQITDKQVFRERSVLIARFVYFISFPVFAFLTVAAGSVMYVLFGPQWIEGGWMLSILGLAGMPMVVKAMSRNIIKSTGRTSYILRMETISSFIIWGVLAVSVLISFRAMLWGIVLANTAAAFLSMYYVAKTAGYPIGGQFRNIVPFIGLFGAALLAGYGICRAVDGPHIVLLIISAAACAAATLIAAALMSLPELRMLTGYVKARFRNKDQTMSC